jgi:hypothetical protein
LELPGIINRYKDPADAMMNKIPFRIAICSNWTLSSTNQAVMVSENNIQPIPTDKYNSAILAGERLLNGAEKTFLVVTNIRKSPDYQRYSREELVVRTSDCDSILH